MNLKTTGGCLCRPDAAWITHYLDMANITREHFQILPFKTHKDDLSTRFPKPGRDDLIFVAKGDYFYYEACL